MVTYTFPADGFVVQGDHEAVRESGRAYGRFATLAGAAAARLHGLDSGAWVGSEGDLFRARVAELPPHLDTAQGAFSQVAGALGGFAEVLAAAQRQIPMVVSFPTRDPRTSGQRHRSRPPRPTAWAGRGPWWARRRAPPSAGTFPDPSAGEPS